jgi:hypothetical protein
MCILNDPDLAPRLCQPERLLLWGMRAWVVGFRRAIPVEEPMARIFSAANAPDAPILIDAFMSLVACATPRPLTIECVCCKQVSEDERRLVDCVALLQAGRHMEALTVLRTILPSQAAPDGMELATRLAAILEDAGQILQPPADQVSRYCMTSAPVSSDGPRLVTLH